MLYGEGNDALLAKMVAAVFSCQTSYHDDWNLTTTSIMQVCACVWRGGRRCVCVCVCVWRGWEGVSYSVLSADASESAGESLHSNRRQRYKVSDLHTLTASPPHPLTPSQPYSSRPDRCHRLRSRHCHHPSEVHRHLPASYPGTGALRGADRGVL